MTRSWTCRPSPRFFELLSSLRSRAMAVVESTSTTSICPTFCCDGLGRHTSNRIRFVSPCRAPMFNWMCGLPFRSGNKLLCGPLAANSRLGRALDCPPAPLILLGQRQGRYWAWRRTSARRRSVRVLWRDRPFASGEYRLGKPALNQGATRPDTSKNYKGTAVRHKVSRLRSRASPTREFCRGADLQLDFELTDDGRQ